MKKLIFAIITISVLNSCIKDYNTNISYNIKNSSGQKITLVSELPIVGSGFNFDSIIIQNNRNYEITYSEPGGYAVLPFGEINFIKVYFNDTTLLMNYRDSISDFPSGNIQKEEDWTGGKIDEYHYEFEFNYTAADYQEALKNQ